MKKLIVKLLLWAFPELKYLKSFPDLKNLEERIKQIDKAETYYRHAAEELKFANSIGNDMLEEFALHRGLLKQLLEEMKTKRTYQERTKHSSYAYQKPNKTRPYKQRQNSSTENKNEQ